MTGLIGQYTPEALERYIEKNFGDLVSWEGKFKNLTKFGSNADVGTTLEDIWQTGGVESLPTVAQGNPITHIASSSASDTQVIIVEGHTQDSEGNLTFVVQSVTLAGQTKTALPTPLARATRAYNASATSLVGTVYIARNVTFTAGVPASDIHITIQIGFEQSQKASTSISQYDYWAISQLSASVRRTQTRFADFFFQVREQGGVFRTRLQPVSVSNNSGTIIVDLDQPFIVKPNSDFRVQGVSSGVTTQLAASAYGTLLIKKSQL